MALAGRAFAALIFAVGCFAIIGACGAVAAPKASDLVQSELVVEPRAVEPGKTFTVAVRLTVKEHWHTYWRNPGDSGLATEIAWTLPPGFTAGPILWPTPERIPVSHLVNYGYDGETSLLVDITPPASLPTGSVALKANVSYLVCERECIPGEAALTATVPVAPAGGGGPDPATRYIFDAARSAQPVTAPWPASVQPDGERLTLRVDTAGLKPETLKSAYFFPVDETAIDHAAPQPLAVDARGLTLSLQRSALSTGPAPTDLAGVLVLEENLGGTISRQAFQIGSAAPSGAGSAALAPPAPARAGVVSDLSWLTVAGSALFAFLGGLLLNLMPCVFPVLSIKVLSLVRHSGHGPRAIRIGGLAYAAGVVSSFLLLAGVLLALRAGGAEIGWGFQLQSPAVVVALAFLLFAMGLSLSGAVEFGTSIAGRAAGIGGGSGLSGSFLTGVLAAVVATPCTAPFMGAAVGFALTSPAPVALVVFGSLGLGMAAPFLLLTLRPSLLSWLPRPGGWMDALKQVLAFPVYATVAWLLFVLSQQVGPSGLFAALLGLVLVGFAAWSWRLAVMGEGFGRRLGQGLALASVLCLVAVGWSVSADRAGAATARNEGGIERFTQARLDQLRQDGRPVFVNMTAAWCITCIVNERAVLSTAAIKSKFDQSGLVYLKGDWTNQDPEITRLLEKHGRIGVPLYVVYPAAGEPVVLPQILTQAVVLDSLSSLPAASRRADLRNPRSTSQE